LALGVFGTRVTEVAKAYCTDLGASNVDVRSLTALVWALTHGLAALWLDGPLERRSAMWQLSLEALVQSVAGQLDRLLLA
jgi:hypothetical protein